MLLLQGGGLAGSGQGADSTGGSIQRVPRGVRPAAPTADASCRALHAPCPRRRTRGQSAAPKPQRSSPRGLPVQDPVPGRHVASRPQPAAQRLSGDEPPGSEGVSGWPDRGPRMPRSRGRCQSHVLLCLGLSGTSLLAAVEAVRQACAWARSTMLRAHAFPGAPLEHGCLEDGAPRSDVYTARPSQPPRRGLCVRAVLGARL